MEYKANLFDYLDWRGDLTLATDPFNEIDGMILSRFAYAFFGLVMEQKADFIRLKDIAGMLLDYPDMASIVLEGDDMRLYRRMAECPRFCNMMVGNFVDLFDKVQEIQFSAYTVKLDENSYCAVYRGTDNTVVGWKENMNMGFTSPLMSQKLAVEYLNDFAQSHEGNLFLAGHSKGGNLASYAAAFCRQDVQERIIGVYNYDGPGFHEAVLEAEGFRVICDRIHTFVPQASLVGVLLGHKEEHRVIHSLDFRGPVQHNMYSWEVRGNHFVYEEKTTSASQFFNQTLKEWLAKMDMEQREKFVEALYSVISETNDRTLNGMKENWLENSKLIIKSLAHMDEESRGIIQEGLALLMHTMRPGSRKTHDPKK